MIEEGRCFICKEEMSERDIAMMECKPCELIVTKKLLNEEVRRRDWDSEHSDSPPAQVLTDNN